MEDLDGKRVKSNARTNVAADAAASILYVIIFMCESVYVCEIGKWNQTLSIFEVYFGCRAC